MRNIIRSILLHYELSFPVIELFTASGCCDGNMDFFFTFVDESFMNKDFAPNSGSYSLRGSCEWLSMIPVNDSIAAGSSQVLDFSLTSESLIKGVYDAFISMNSNDMFNPNPSLPVTLEVIGVPDISVDPMMISFGEVEIGDTITDTIRITNVGDGILSIINIECTNSDFYVQSFTGDISPGNFMDCLINFTPSIEDQLTGEVSIHSNDPDESQIIIPLSGTGFQVILPPDPPQNVTVELSGNSVLISWDTQTRSDADRSMAYVVYSSEFPDSGFTEDLTGTYTSNSWTAPFIYDRRFFYVCADEGSSAGRKSVLKSQTRKAGKSINRIKQRNTIHELPVKKKKTDKKLYKNEKIEDSKSNSRNKKKIEIKK